MSNSENVLAFDVKLEVPLTIASKDGDTTEVDTLTILAPASRDRKESSKIKNFYADIMRRFREKQAMDEDKAEEIAKAIERLEELKKKKDDGESKEKDEPFNGKNLEAICNMVEIDDDRQNNVYDWLKTLLVKNEKGNFDGIPMTGDLFNDLDFNDLNNISCQYAVSFLIRSLVN